MIKNIKIEKFKGINSLNIRCAGEFNVLIGANNIGKTTIFEAIHLWKKCYDVCLKKDKTGFYAKARTLLFKDMDFIRVVEDRDIFPVGCPVKNATTTIELEIQYQEDSFKLGFLVSKVSTIDNAYLQLDYVDFEEFKRFEECAKTIGKKLDVFLTVTETRPVANIVTKEPYMYKAQVIDKISKGKSFEVLRNKLRDKAGDVQVHINSVLGTNYSISEVDKDNKQYINIRVDGKNILSFGSGFLQLADIFSSIEYLGSEISILLIDEPDSHLHIQMQKKLVEELRSISSTQLFIITHNDRFLEYANEDEIIFIDVMGKEVGSVEPLKPGTKALVLENLSGCLAHIDKLRFANKVVLVEGDGDLSFLNELTPKYESWKNQQCSSNFVILKLDGIDTLQGKLMQYSKTLKGIVPDNCNWLIIRDTDCVPINKTEKEGKENKKSMITGTGSAKVIFQTGYGVESTFLSEHDKLAQMLCAYYELDEENQNSILSIIESFCVEYSSNVKNVTSKQYSEWKSAFDRQKRERTGSVYKELKQEDTLSLITPNTVHYIMTKKMMHWFLEDVHKKICESYQIRSKPMLSERTIFDFYYSWLNGIEDMFVAHKNILEEIYEQ